MWDLPGPGIEPVSPSLAGGFLTTAPPGKSLPLYFKSELGSSSLQPGSIETHPFILPVTCMVSFSTFRFWIHLEFILVYVVSLFWGKVHLILSCKNDYRFHICVLAYGICFSLSDLLHSVWQTLGPSTSLQITQFPSFLWLSNIPLSKKPVLMNLMAGQE